MKLIGVDIGGTFTDLILADPEEGRFWIHKMPTKQRASEAMIEGVQELVKAASINAGEIDHLRLGTTTATNALLQYKGAKTGLITTKGYRDIIFIARHQRPMHYSIMQEMPWQDRELVRRRYRKVVTERLGPSGDVLTELDETEVVKVVEELKEAGVESIAICFLHSYRNSAHEDRVRHIVEEHYPGVFVTTSASIFPQFREYERFTTTCINAFVGPAVKKNFKEIETSLTDIGIKGEFRVMQSGGGVATLETASEKPVSLLMSGPAAGVLAGSWIGKLAGRENLITLDVGGTSADIGIITKRGIVEASARDTWVAGYPVMVPMIDIHTIGAGGGSIARVDSGGAFRVGPQSAGANPGPACYGLGGTEATVTDANVVLKRLDKDFFIGGQMKIDPALSLEVISNLAAQLDVGVDDAAEGVLTIANHNMANAIKARTIQKGHDPRNFSLLAFGGAGPLHAVAVAASMGIPEVIVPSYPGITSAMGLLTTDMKYDLIQNEFMLSENPDAQRLDKDLHMLEERAREYLSKDGVADTDMVFIRGADCRYVGQGYELRATIPDGEVTSDAVDQIWSNFHAIHEEEYGRMFLDNPIELVNLRVMAIGQVPKLQASVLDNVGAVKDAILGQDELLFRVDSKVQSYVTNFYLRERLPADEDFDGPAIVLQNDSTTVIPPNTNVVLDSVGNMILTII